MTGLGAKFLVAAVEPLLVAGQQRAIETKRRILEEATRLFSSKGYDACSVREIATAAQVKHQVIAYHFGSKEDLWDTVVAELFRDHLSLGESFVFDPDAGDTVEQFRDHVRQLVEYLARHPETLRIEYYEVLTDSPRLERRRALEMQFVSFALDYFRKAQSHGIGANIPVEDLYFIFSGALQRRFLRPDVNEMITGRRVDDEAIIESHTNAIVRLLTGK